jgi:TonB family protein
MSSSMTQPMAIAAIMLLGASWAHVPHASGMAFVAAARASAAEPGQANTPPSRRCQSRPPIPGPRAMWAAGVSRVDELAQYRIQTPTKVWDVRPVYPPNAKAGGVEGVVVIDARIEVDGCIRNAEVVRSVPELDQAALDAVTQWEFLPTTLNGKPVPVLMTITIRFTLS